MTRSDDPSTDAIFVEDGRDDETICAMAEEAKRRLDHIVSILDRQSDDARTELAQALYDLGMRLGSSTFARE